MSNFDKLWNKVSVNPHDFNTWTGLLEIADKQEDPDKYREVFDKFLEFFPYCYGYWKKYADLEKHKHGREAAIKVLKKGTEAIPLSIDIWIAYADIFVEANQSSPTFERDMRDLYEKAIDMAGLEFRSDGLWEHFISWETSSNRYVNARMLYERLLAIPTQLYFQNWDSFKRLIEDNSLLVLMEPEELAPFHAKIDAKACKGIEDGLYLGILLPGDDEPEVKPGEPRKFLITFEEEETLKQMIVNSREKIYQATYQQIMKRWFFEEKIRRPYFHVKALDEAQVTNWADYLSFEIAELHCLEQMDESQKEQLCGSHAGSKRVRVLFERCIIACALYEHVWIRYAQYLEKEEHDLLAAYRVYFRACNIHLRNKPTINFHWALFLDRNRDLNTNNIIPIENSLTLQGWPLMPIQSVNNLGGLKNQNVLPNTGLEVLTALEQRLPNSALVCSRRTDFMRRSGSSLDELMICLRSGINRLRYAACEQYKRAYEVRGTSASVSAQRFLVLSQQAKVGSAFLTCKMARMLQHIIPDGGPGIPKWKLLLDTCYNPSTGTKPKSLKRDLKLEPNEKDAKIPKLDPKIDDDSEVASSPPDILVQTSKVVNGHQDQDITKKENKSEEASSFKEDEELELEVNILHLPDVRSLTENDRVCISGFEAAVEVIKEAFDYDPHNERILMQWLDLIYQNRPIDLQQFVAVCDKVITNSTLPEESKLSFMQRKLQVLEEFASKSHFISEAYDQYYILATSMSNFRNQSVPEHEPYMYPAHQYQDLLNITPASALLQSKLPNAVHSQTSVASYAPMNKAVSSEAIKSLMQSAESFQGTLNNCDMQSHYTAGAYDPMGLAQGDVSGMPPPVPVVPLVHPPMGDTSTQGAVQNEAWRKAAAAVGQHMIQPHIVEHV